MRHDPLEIRHANPKGRMHRIWYGHGSTRLITDNARDVAPAHVVDEAIATFQRFDVAADPRLAETRPHVGEPLRDSHGTSHHRTANPLRRDQ